jgi:hypothetical protein
MKVNDEAIRQALKPRMRWNPWKCIPLVVLMYTMASLIIGVLFWAWVM